jgi:hypothetical protein
VYICKFRVLVLSSGIGVLKKVILGHPVGGVYGGTKNPPSRVPGGGKMKIYKNENKKCILYTICSI